MDDRQLMLDLEFCKITTVTMRDYRVEKIHPTLELSRGNYRFRN